MLPVFAGQPKRCAYLSAPGVGVEAVEKLNRERPRCVDQRARPTLAGRRKV